MTNLIPLKLDKYKYMIYIYFFFTVAISFVQISCEKIFEKLLRKTFGTFCAYSPFPNTIKNNILNLAVNSS